MLLSDQQRKTNPVKAETFAICLLLTCSLQIMENLLPRIPIFPWLRIGLAYWILLPFLVRFGVTQGLMLFLLRNLMTLIYGGQIFSSFLISSSAGFASFIVCGSLGRYLYARDKLSLVSLSILMACSFNASQLFIVDKLLINHSDFYFQLAPILIWSLISGTIIAILVQKSQATLHHIFTTNFPIADSASSKSELTAITPCKWLAIPAVVMFCAIFIFRNPGIQLAFLAVLIFVVGLKNTKILIYAWPFYFYIAWLHLFRTDGTDLIGHWITQEGLDAFIYYTLRTTNIILCGQWLARYIPALLKKVKNNRYLEGTGFALPLLPSIFGISMTLGKDLLGKVRKKDFENLLDPILERLLEEFVKQRGIHST